jgi:glycosyltransferase involved in cell wall biosynthesis
MVVRSPFELILLTIFKSFNRGKWPIVFEAHSTKLSPSSSIAAIMRLPFKMAVSRASLVIAASKSVARGEQCRGAKNVSIHYFGGKKCLIERRNYDLTFIFVGRLVELKEPHKLLDAVSALANKLREACGKVLIIGNGPLEESLRKKVTSLGLVDIVKILGYQSNLSPYYSNSDYLISTSRFEGLPLTFFEAKMSGLKIITTPSSGDFDILGVEDHILKDFSVEAIIGGISVAIDHGLVEKEERREIQEKYSWMDSSLCVEKYNKLLDILLSEFSD